VREPPFKNDSGFTYGQNPWFRRLQLHHHWVKVLAAKTGKYITGRVKKNCTETSQHADFILSLFFSAVVLGRLGAELKTQTMVYSFMGQCYVSGADPAIVSDPDPFVKTGCS